MSKIFHALKLFERERATNRKFPRRGSDTTDGADRRRSRRRGFDVRVYVYAHELDKGPYHEETYTINVNAQGALLLLSVPVCEGQRLLLTNALNQQEQDCRIVRLGMRRTRTVEAAVVFPYPNPSFWPLPKEPKNDTCVIIPAQ